MKGWMEESEMLVKSFDLEGSGMQCLAIQYSLLLRSVWRGHSTVNLPESRQMKKIEQRVNMKFLVKLKNIPNGVH